MPQHANRTSFKSGQVPWNKIYASEHERYLAHRPEVLRRTRANHIKKKFGISFDEYHSRKKKQGRLCAACGKRMIERKGIRGTTNSSPVLDHDHRTDQVRDFVHRSCNVAIGLLNDNPETFRKVAAYLEKYRARK